MRKWLPYARDKAVPGVDQKSCHSLSDFYPWHELIPNLKGRSMFRDCLFWIVICSLTSGVFNLFDTHSQLMTFFRCISSILALSQSFLKPDFDIVQSFLTPIGEVEFSCT